MDWRQRYLTSVMYHKHSYTLYILQVVVVAGDLVLQKELWNRAQRQVVVVTNNELSKEAKEE